MATVTSDTEQTLIPGALLLNKLTPAQVVQIDEALAAIGDYGEVRLIVQRGELRYINKVESYKAVQGGNGRKPGV